MKKSITTILFLLPILLSAQTKEDVVNCMIEVMNVEQLAPYFQFQEQEFGEIIIQQSNGASINQSPENRIMKSFSNEDFYDAPYRVAVLDEFQYKNRDFNPQKLMSINSVIRGNQIIVNIRAWREDNQQVLTGYFLFKQNNGDWELISQSVDERS